MRSRYYSPAQHQFLSADSYMGDLYHPLSLNPYSYVEGNPVRYIDPMGYRATEFATYDSGNERTRKDREVIRKFDEVLTYVNREKEKAYYALEYGVHSIEQVIGGNYSNQTTLLGTTGQVALSASGFDLPMDLRDLTYDIQHFECTKGHMMQTGIDAIGLLPLVGMLKHGDEVGTLVKNADEIADSVKKGLYQGGQAAEELLEQINETTEFVENTKKTLKSKGEFHHIASNRSKISNFTERYEEIFERAGMSLDDGENIMFLENHRGAHTKKYEKYVLLRIDSATKGLDEEEARKALIRELRLLRKELLENPKMPYKGGL